MRAAPANWATVKSIVAEAIELPPVERPSFVAARTADNADLRSEVESLVAAATSTDGVLSPPLDAWVGLGGPDLRALKGRQLGRYRLERLIAEGTTAAVYAATQATPQRRVAIKLLREPLPLVEASGRFAREIAALGRLEHPHIARIYEAGVHRTESGVRLPYLVMEYVDGVPITDFVRRAALPQRAIVELMRKVASAVHGAHQQAVIHRDLKPANVLVDAAGEPRVLDFGIARILGSDDDDRTWQTAAGMLVGTPSYMSPEQAAGRAGEVDVRTDVWGLGVMLYELLTGRLPVDVRGLPLTEVLRRIESAESAPPSRVAASISSDLDVIVTTALAREKNGRYASAQALADDLTRYLDNVPIAARAPTLRYRLGTFARRHRIGIIVAGLFLAMLLTGSALLAVAYVDANRERDRARAVNTLLREMISAADPHYGDRNVTMAAVLASAEARMSAMQTLRPEVEAGVRSALGILFFGLGEYARARDQLTRAVELRRGIVADSDAELLADQAQLAVVLRWLYEPGAARDLAQHVQATAQRALGAGHLTTLIAAETLAGCLHDEQNLAAAEAAYRDVVAACRTALGPAHDQTLTTLGNLAVVLSDSGRYAEAEALTRDVLAARLETGGSLTLHTITLRGNLARLMAEQGRLDAAIDEMRAVLADAVRYLGEPHEHTLECRASLAEFLRRGGRTDEATAMLRTLLEERIATLGWTQDQTLDACAGYTAMLLRLKRYHEAYALASHAVVEASNALGPEHLRVLRNRLNLAAALAGLGSPDAARAIYVATIAALEQTIGPDHAQTLVARINFGLALVEAGEGAAAIDVLELALERVLANTFESMEPVVRRNLGQALALVGRAAEAEAQLVAAFELSRRRGEHENTARAAAALAALCESAGRTNDAACWRDLARPAHPVEP